jgi:glutathione-specific gamma-glutamylcyclotransferase
VFAYGSLMWRPDFPFIEAIPARLSGWHRAMCILSIHYRGTEEQPGLVLGLDRGGSCRGMAFRVDAAAWPEIRDILHVREMPTAVYRPRFLPVRLENGIRIPAYAFIVDRDHRQYWRGSESDAVALIRQGCGLTGRSRDYLADTVHHLQNLGLRDGGLERLLRKVDER